MEEKGKEAKRQNLFTKSKENKRLFIFEKCARMVLFCYFLQGRISTFLNSSEAAIPENFKFRFKK